jgi:hypothetical protein
MGTIAQKDRTRIIAALQKKTQAANQEYANKTGETYKKFNPEFGPVAPKGGLGLPPVIAKTDPLVPSTGNLGLDKQIDNAVLNPDATASAVLNPEGQIQFQENLPNEQDHAIQEQSTGGVLTHPQTEGSEPGGVGSSIQGQETAPARQEEGQVNGPTTGSLVSPGEQVQNPEVQALQAERDSKIQEVSRPETKLALLSDKKVLDTKVDVTGPGGETTTMPARRLHRKIEVESNQLEELLDCLHGIRK